MRKLLTILFFIPLLSSGQGILIGYVKSSGSQSTSNASLTNINTAVYSRYRTFSQIAEGDTLYTNVGLTTPLPGNLEWWGYNTTNGGNTSYRSYRIANTGIVQLITTHHTAYTHYLNFGGDCSVTSASVNDAEAVSADDDTSIYVGKRTIKWNGADFSSGTAAAVLKVRTAGTAYYQITFGSFSKIATVSKCAVANQPPVPNAGPDQSITLPVSTVTLNGSSSADPDGTITAYAWSKVVGGTATITSPSSVSTTVTGLDFGLYSFELAVTDNNGLIRKDTVDVAVQPAGGSTVIGKLMIDYRWSYQNNSFTGDLKPMFDGNTGTYAFTGYNSILNPCWIVIDIPDSVQLDLTKVRMYGGDFKVIHKDGAGNPIDTVYYPLDVYYNDTLLAHKIGTYLGSGNAWVETNITSVRVNRIWMRKRKMESNADALPSEFELVGTYHAWQEQPARIKPHRYEDVAAGANHHIWHVIQNSRFGWNDVPYPPKMDALRMLANHSRPYIDANYLNPTQNTYTFGPTPNGNYSIDTLLQSLKANGIAAMPCIKTMPAWMTGKAYSEAVPNWPIGSDFSSPASYIDFGKLFWQFAKRYGHDTSNSNKIKIDPNYRAYTGGPLNTKRAGLGFIDEVECENERDKSWQGRGSYQTPFEYAAMLSACWDGHMGTLGDTVGVHNADPTMRLVMAGTAQAEADYMRGIADWWRMNRGEELPSLIVFNFHDYSNDGEQNASSRAMPPETGLVPEKAALQTYVAQRASGDTNRLVYQSEYSFGTHKISGQGVHSIGTHTQEEVAGWWQCRQSLEYWRLGIDKAFPYELFDDQPHTFGQYAMSGLLVSETEPKTVFEYVVQQRRVLNVTDTPVTLSLSPRVVRGQRNGKYVYVAWMPTEKDSVATFTLTKQTGENYVKFYNLAKGKLRPDITFVPFSGSTMTIVVHEWPTYFEPVASNATFTTPTANAGPDQTITRPTSEITLSNAGSTLGQEYYWQKLSGPLGCTIWAPYEATTQVTNLLAGTYKFTLKVWNTDGVMSVDTMQVTVNPVSGNIPPVAAAGVDQSFTLPQDHIDLTNPNGTDADGTITGFYWEKLSGPIDFNLRFPDWRTPRFDNMLPGVYSLKFQVVDNAGSIAYDTMNVTVNSNTGNIGPSVNAGEDQNIIQGTDLFLTGNASDVDGSISAYNWTKISGSGGTILTPTSQVTTVTGLTQGDYVFRLTVTDNSGATAYDEININVYIVAGIIRIRGYRVRVTS